MPELPEVETIRRGLEGKIVGKKIIDVSFNIKKSFMGDPKLVIGNNVLSVARRAKVLRIRLDNSTNLLFHLKMTGQLIYIEPNLKRIAGGHPSHDWHDRLPNQHTRVIFSFNDGSVLFFNDMRKFGWVKVLTDEEVKLTFSKYGPEPFSKEFNASYLETRAKNIPNRKIKQFLMDQEIIAGIGNIYNDESLFLAGIMPTSKVGALKTTDWEKVVNSVKEILELSIKHRGTTDSDYVDAIGRKGGMQDYLNVYHKEGEPCPKKCSGTIQRIKLGSRSTYFCSECQKEIL